MTRKHLMTSLSRLRSKLFGVIALMALVPLSAHAGTWQYGVHSTPHGTRAYQLWVPTGYTAGSPIPLVVSLHPCGLVPSAWAGLTRLNALADTRKFMVLYPRQSIAVNPSGCWNWFLSSNQSRGAGEPGIVKSMVDWIKSQYSIDNKKVYVFGLSAGAAMTSTMLACYSDVFAAGAIGAGFMYKAATDPIEAAGLPSNGSIHSPTLRGLHAWQCSGAPTPRRTGVLVFQGSADTLVGPINSDQIITQFAKTNDYSDDGSSNNTVRDVATGNGSGSAGGRSFTWRHFQYGGKLLLSYYTIIGMGHTWSGGDPFYSPGVSTAGPDASAIMWNFFTQHSL